MLRGVLLLVAVSGCDLYFAEDMPGQGSDDTPDDATPSGDGQTVEQTPAIDTTTPPEACTPLAVTVTPPSDPADPAFGCTPPTLSADRWIVFDSDRDLFTPYLYIMRADGSHVCRITAGVAVDKEPAPSFDGTKIAFSSNRSGTFQIHVLDFDTQTVTQVTMKGGHEPAFSRNGSSIAFRRGTAIYTIRADGTGEKMIADSQIDQLNAYSNPQFSVDDTELYFDRNNELNAIGVDGSGFRRIVNNWTTNIRAPSPVSNGLAVAYEVSCDGLSIWLTPTQFASDPCTGRRATPHDPARPARRPALGPDDIIAFERESSNSAAAIVLVDTEPNSQLCPITSDPYDHRNPAWLIR